jgi:hypothetical protein
MADYAYGPLFAALDSTHQKLIPKGVVSKLSKFQGEHTYTGSAFYPPFDLVSRNITTWLSKDLTIGAESFDETVIGGPARSQTSFNPAVIQWDTGDEIAFISVRSYSYDASSSTNKSLALPNRDSPRRGS